jgi:hypothetical protein
MEGAADRREWRWPPGNALHAHLSHLAAVGGQWLHRPHFSLARCRGFIRTGLLDAAVIHSDGTAAAAKKGGHNLGFSGHKKVKGDKVVAFRDRRCNVIAPFVTAPGNRNESPLLREALPEVRRIAREVGMDLQGTVVSLGARFRFGVVSMAWVVEFGPGLPGHPQWQSSTAAWFATSSSPSLRARLAA